MCYNQEKIGRRCVIAKYEPVEYEICENISADPPYILRRKQRRHRVEAIARRSHIALFQRAHDELELSEYAFIGLATQYRQT